MFEMTTLLLVKLELKFIKNILLLLMADICIYGQMWLQTNWISWTYFIFGYSSNTESALHK